MNKGYFYSDVIIAPNLKKFKSTSLEGADEMINEGYKLAKQHIDEILELFSRKPLKRKYKLNSIFANTQNRIIENGLSPEIVNQINERDLDYKD